MVHYVKAANITELSYKLTKRLVYAAPDEIDYITSADCQLHNVIAEAKSCNYSLDLKDVWLTPIRWSSLVRQYIDPVAYENWLTLCENKLTGRKRGVSFMRTNQVKARTAASTGREWRRWGSCMLGVGYRAMPRPQLTLHSRTTYLGYIGQLDLGVAHVLARDVAARVGLDPADITFVWHLEMGAFHGFKSFAWFYQRPDDQSMLEGKRVTKKEMPTLALAQRELERIRQFDRDGVKYGDMSFAQQLRIRRRYHTEILGEDYANQFVGGTRRPSMSLRNGAHLLPSTRIEDLEIAPLLDRYGDDTLSGFEEEE